MSASDAVHRLIAAGAGTAICWRVADGHDIRLGTTTAFGPIVRSWQGATKEFLDRLLTDTERASSAALFVAGPVDEDLETVFSRVSAATRSVPARRTRDGDTAFWWCSNRVGATPFRIGDRLKPRIERSEGGWDVRYRAADGRDAGLHVRLDKEPTVEQRAVVDASMARVERVAFGSEMGSGGDEIPTQLLVLSIPHGLAVAFPEGKLPRVRDQAAVAEHT